MQVYFILFALPLSVIAIDCVGRPDGAYEIGCKSYATCSNGVVTIHDCQAGQVYDNTTQSCKNVSQAHGICSQNIDCTGKTDGKYADQSTHCKTYYTCSGGTFLGHNLCSSVLVFDEAKQTCNWPAEVDPPCGNKGSSPQG